MKTHVRVLVVGAGFAGLGTAIRLLEEGIRDFVVLERAGEVGGVWRDNRYPGCACDVPSHLYSLSFAPNPSWSRSYSRQPEILAHLQDLVARFGLSPWLRFHHEVEEARFDEQTGRWHVRSSGGDFTADVLVAASGALSEPALPRLEGLEEFPGKVMHSARWDESYELTGRRVAVVGTGASAIQIVPAIQPLVERLVVFQRTPPWVLARRDKPLSPLVRRLFERMPLAHAAYRAWLRGAREWMAFAFRHPRVLRLIERLARVQLRRAVPDEELRRRLLPSYTIGCKRILLSDDYWQALRQPNVTLVDGGVRELRGATVVAENGEEHEVDTLVLATGFDVRNPPIAKRVFGRGGVSLADAWGDHPEAHVGTTVAGFPSFFLLQGPHTGLGHSSVLIMIESQIEHLLGALRFLDETGGRALEPTPAAQRVFVEGVEREMRGTVWVSGGCKSWYLDESGRNWTLWPGTTRSFERRVARFDPAEYTTEAKERPRA